MEDDLPDEQVEEPFLKQYLAWWDTAVVELRERMKQYNEQMKNTYKTKQQASAENLRYILVPGMKVLVKARTPSKLGASWEGPWMVLRLMGPADNAVEVLTDAHKAHVVGVVNVKLYHGDEPIRVTK